MPVGTCHEGGRAGYRWGQTGKCYTYPAGDEAARKRAKRRAHIQGAAAEANGAKAFDASWVNDPELWDSIRAALVPRVYRRLREAFMVGAEMGARQKPSTRADGPNTAGDVGELITGSRDVTPGEQTAFPYDLEAVNTAADETIANYTDGWWQQFSANTQRRLREAIDRANRLGLTVEDVRREITPLFGAQRAELIAVSELTNVLGLGAQATYRAAGFARWEWRTVRDSAVDPICSGRHGRRYPMSVPFRRAHPRCRCWPVPVGRPTAGRLPRLF